KFKKIHFLQMIKEKLCLSASEGALPSHRTRKESFLFIASFGRSLHVCNKCSCAQRTAWLHLDRVARRDCHHRHPNWPVTAGRAKSPRGRCTHAERQQSQATRAGLPQLRRRHGGITAQRLRVLRQLEFRWCDGRGNRSTPVER